MRLGQLGRKLSLRPAEIVEFLASKNIEIANGSNTRIEDEHALLVIRQFAPGQENLLKEDEQTEQVTTSPIIELPAMVVEEAVQRNEPKEEPKEESTPQKEIISAIEEEQTEPQSISVQDEVIKAPKVELPGLKVLGKIELPEPKKKEEEPREVADDVNAEKDVTPPATQPKRTPGEDRRMINKRRERNDLRPRKNPVALQREREALEAEQRRKEEIEKQKQKRTQNYLKKVKIVQPTKAARLNKEEVIDMTSLPEDKPKTLWGKIVHWLTTA